MNYYFAWQTISDMEFLQCIDIKPSSDVVLHMSRIEFNELTSCEVRRLNQFRTADLLYYRKLTLHAINANSENSR